MQKIENFPTNTRNAKYDWNSLFDGSIWELVQGEDFTVSAQSFRGAVYAAKVARGVEVKSAKVVRDGKTIVVLQMTGTAKAKTPAKAEAKPKAKPQTAAAKKAAAAKRAAAKVAKA